MEVRLGEGRTLLSITSAPRREVLVTLVLVALGLFVWKDALAAVATMLLHPSQFARVAEEIILHLSSPAVWPVAILRAIFGIITIGCGLVFPGDVERCIIDKKRVRLSRTPLLRSFISSKHEREVSQDLEYLDVIQVEECPSKRGAYRIRLVFEEGSVCLPVTQAYHIDLARQMGIAENIRQFVGLDEAVARVGEEEEDTEEEEKKSQ
jgi:hypothetical protein